MKRDWDVIREVLIEVEGLSDDNSDRGSNNRSQKIYGMRCFCGKRATSPASMRGQWAGPQ